MERFIVARLANHRSGQNYAILSLTNAVTADFYERYDAVLQDYPTAINRVDRLRKSAAINKQVREEMKQENK